MRRIFTSVFLLAAFVVASINLYAQTASCSTPTTSGTIGDYNQVDASTTAIVNGATVTYNSPISYFNTSRTTIPFYLRLQKTQTNGGNSTWIATVTVKWGSGGSQSFTCTASSEIGSPAETPSSTVYYFSITPNTPLPANTNFQISVAIQNTGNRSMAVIGYGIDDEALTPAGAALPVKFQTLDATASSSAVALKWMVAAEENLSGYAIEKSTDGRTYMKIGFVSASGQTNYSYVDNKPADLSYYRIKSIDIDGKFAYSTVAMVKAGKSLILLKAFPSPVISNVVVQHPTATAGSTITVNSEDGRLIKSIVPLKGTQQTDINISTAKPGLYLLRFANANGDVETLKILKQ